MVRVLSLWESSHTCNRNAALLSVPHIFSFSSFDTGWTEAWWQRRGSKMRHPSKKLDSCWQPITVVHLNVYFIHIQGKRRRKYTRTSNEYSVSMGILLRHDAGQIHCIQSQIKEPVLSCGHWVTDRPHMGKRWEEKTVLLQESQRGMSKKSMWDRAKLFYCVWSTVNESWYSLTILCSV